MLLKLVEERSASLRIQHASYSQTAFLSRIRLRITAALYAERRHHKP